MSSEPTPIPNPKAFQCQMCSRSFATKTAMKAHSRDTGHLIFCTMAGCPRGFVSEVALAAHLAAARHPPQKNGWKKKTKTVKPIQNPSPKQSAGSVPIPKCNKTFQTQGARSDHLQSPAHKKVAVQATDDKVGQVVCSVEQSGMNGPLTAALHAVVMDQLARKAEQNATAGKEKHIMHVQGDASRLKSTAKAGETALLDKKPAQSSKTPKLPPSNPRSIKPSLKPKPLYRWDTRWSSIPTASHERTLTALRSQIPTPSTSQGNKTHQNPIQEQARAPAPNPVLQKRPAITIDCEMIGTGPAGSVSSLARLSALDFLTGEPLIDSLVRPSCAVTDWRTRYSGITPAAMTAAIEANDVLDGTTAAREELFEYIDASTVLVGHALHHDLTALGLWHTQTVDSEVLAKNAVGKRSKRGWGLKLLCKELLGVVVQDGGKQGHDAVEDALAAREVVLWCLEHAGELREWGVRKRREGYQGKGKGKKKRCARPSVSAPPPAWCDYVEQLEYRSLSLREFNELCGYPEWYDNWSD